MSTLRRPGRILAVKLGFNPNSSSLGVDVTFLLFGLSVVALLTPIIAFLLRFRAQRPAGPLRDDEPQAASRTPAP